MNYHYSGKWGGATGIFATAKNIHPFRLEWGSPGDEGQAASHPRQSADLLAKARALPDHAGVPRHWSGEKSRKENFAVGEFCPMHSMIHMM